VLGLALASLVVAGVRTQIAGFFTLSMMGRETWLEGLALAVLVGLLVGAMPALRGMRLRIVDALANR
jgi:putative ABC transport system permease protein